MIRKHFVQRVLADDECVFDEEFIGCSFLAAAGSVQTQLLPRLAECVELCQKLQLAAEVEDFGEKSKEAEKSAISGETRKSVAENGPVSAKKWPGLRTDIDCAPGVSPSVVRETAAFNGRLLGALARERPSLEGAAEPRTAFFALL